MKLTHEHEITQPVRLCEPGGRYLNPHAVGWSRVPLHDCNLAGAWGRNKRWDYWAILAPGFTVSITYADVDYLGMATIWWADLATGETGGHDVTVPFARGIDLPDRPGTSALTHTGSHSQLEMTDDEFGTTITASWTEPDGRPGQLELMVELPAGHDSLNVVIPWSRRRFQYTSKHQARPAHGLMRVGDDVRVIGERSSPTGNPSDRTVAPIEVDAAASGAGPDAAWGVLDVGRGRWPYRTRWNWGGGAGQAVDGPVVGLQFGGKWTVGTGHTENGVIVDGRLTKIGAELAWDYTWDDPMGPWRVRDPQGSLDVTLSPVYDRHTKVNAVILGTEVHQVFGTWSGHVTGDDGVRHEIDGILGFAEESRSRW